MLRLEPERLLEIVEPVGLGGNPMPTFVGNVLLVRKADDIKYDEFGFGETTEVPRGMSPSSTESFEPDRRWCP